MSAMTSFSHRRKQAGTCQVSARPRRRLSSCAAQVRQTMRSLVAKHLMRFPKVCLHVSTLVIWVVLTEALSITQSTQ